MMVFTAKRIVALLRNFLYLLVNPFSLIAKNPLSIPEGLGESLCNIERTGSVSSESTAEEKIQESLGF